MTQTNHEIQLKNHEDSILAAMQQDAKTVMSMVLTDADSASLFTSYEARVLFETIKKASTAKNDTSVSSILLYIDALTISADIKKKIKSRFETIMTRTLPSTPEQVAAFSIQEILDIRKLALVEKRIDSIKTNLGSGNLNSEKVQEELLDIYMDIAGGITGDKPKPLARDIRKLVNPDPNQFKPIKGIDSGYKTLDAAIHGLRPGLYTIVGDTGDGKSTLLCNIAKNVVVSGKKVLVINIEMSRDEWNLKTLSSIAKINSDHIMTGSFLKDKREKAAVDEAIKVMESWDDLYFYEEVPTIEPRLIYKHITTYAFKYNVDVILFDHIKVPDDTLMGEGYTVLGNITSKLHRIANLIIRKPIISAAQARRPEGNTGRLPGKSDVADSYNVPRNSPVMLSIMSVAAPKGAENFMLQVSKNRGGVEAVQVRMKWTKECNLMEEI
jgi:replicative DNA helicase